MIETATLFFHYLNWNDRGVPTVSITIAGLVFGVTKRAISRVVVQVSAGAALSVSGALPAQSNSIPSFPSLISFLSSPPPRSSCRWATAW